MNIPAVSNLISQWALNSVAKAKEVVEHSQSFLVQEESAPASKKASPRYEENKTSTDQTARDELRFGLGVFTEPPMVANIVSTGEWSTRTGKQRGELWDIVRQNFKEVREEFGCPTTDYMPYWPELPEYDPAIEKAMRESLYKKVIDNPVCERLIKSIGGIFPPPDHLDFSTMVSGNFRDAKEVMAETRRVLQISEPERLGNIKNSSDVTFNRSKICANVTSTPAS